MFSRASGPHGGAKRVLEYGPRNTAKSDDHLKLIIHEIKPELQELRQRWEEWLKKDDKFKHGSTFMLTAIMTAIIFGLPLLGSLHTVLRSSTLFSGIDLLRRSCSNGARCPA